MKTITTLDEAIDALGRFREAEVGDKCATLQFDNGRLLVSYCTAIAVWLHPDDLYVVGYPSYSRTTSRHMNAFFKLTAKGFREFMKEGRIKTIKSF